MGNLHCPKFNQIASPPGTHPQSLIYTFKIDIQVRISFDHNHKTARKCGEKTKLYFIVVDNITGEILYSAFTKSAAMEHIESALKFIGLQYLVEVVYIDNIPPDTQSDALKKGGMIDTIKKATKCDFVLQVVSLDCILICGRCIFQG